MAKYTVLAKTFINGNMREAGEVIEYDGQPGSTLQPMEPRPSIDIPDDWQSENGLKRIALAKSLGAPKQRLSAAEADQWITNEIANREAKSAERKLPSTKPEPLVPSTPIETT